MKIVDAIQARDLGQVERLLASDAALSQAKDEAGVSALLLAIYYRQPKISQAIREARRRQNQGLDIFEAAALGDAGRLEELLKQNAALLSAHSADGWTPLHLAAAFADKRCVEVLLKKGACREARSRNAMSNAPLHAALGLNPSAEVAQALIAAGADVNARQQGGYTPLHEAAASGRLEAVRMLLAAGADASLMSDDGKTARQLAVERQQHEAAQLLGNAASAS